MNWLGLSRLEKTHRFFRVEEGQLKISFKSDAFPESSKSYMIHAGSNAPQEMQPPPWNFLQESHLRLHPSFAMSWQHCVHVGWVRVVRVPVQILPKKQFLEDVAGNGQTGKACEDMIKLKSMISQMCCLSAATAGPTSLSALAVAPEPDVSPRQALWKVASPRVCCEVSICNTSSHASKKVLFK